MPGNVGNTTNIGRPPSQIRKTLRRSFEERIPILEELADRRVTIPVREKCEKCGHEVDGDPLTAELLKDLAPQITDQLKALEMMAKYGLGAAAKEVTVEDVRDRLAETVHVIRDMLDQEMAEAMLERIQPIWMRRREP